MVKTTTSKILHTILFRVIVVKKTAFDKFAQQHLWIQYHGTKQIAVSANGLFIILRRNQTHMEPLHVDAAETSLMWHLLT